MLCLEETRRTLITETQDLITKRREFSNFFEKTKENVEQQQEQWKNTLGEFVEKLDCMGKKIEEFHSFITLFSQAKKSVQQR